MKIVYGFFTGIKARLAGFARFLREVNVELSRVEWPKFDEFVGSTIVVLFLVFVFAVYLGFVDRAIIMLAKQVFAYKA